MLKKKTKKKEDKRVKRYFKNGVVKYTEFVRNLDQHGNEKFDMHFRQFHDCLIQVTEGKKAIKFIIAHGVEFIEREKRSKSLKYTGKEITKEEYEGLVREWKFEVATAKEELLASTPQTNRDTVTEYEKNKNFFDVKEVNGDYVCVNCGGCGCYICE